MVENTECGSKFVHLIYNTSQKSMSGRRVGRAKLGYVGLGYI